MRITTHTGWGACVVVGGSLEYPEIVANVVIQVLGDDDRFCFHVAAGMKLAAARSWLEHVLASHTRTHTAEGCFYRDVFCAASLVPVRIVPPSSLEIARVPKLAPPWGRNQKLAALAAWSLIRRPNAVEEA